MGVPMDSSLYSTLGKTPPQCLLVDDLLSTSAVNNNLDTSSDASLGPRGSPLPGNYNTLPNYNQQYIPQSIDYESWANPISYPIPSNASGPLSSADYVAFYIQISVPSSILPSSISTVYSKDVIEMGFNNIGRCSIIPQGLLPPDVSEEISNTQ